jgi:O-acetyl-ADP-ribose deacetylase (regulator of RNase III)
VLVQAVGVPPYPAERFPRIVGLVQPATAIADRHRLHYVRGDAADPRVSGPTILAHVVNNQARRWGGHGLASELSRRFPQAHEDYQAWAAKPTHLRLGALSVVAVDENLAIANLIAQAGYGDSRSPRLRLRALRGALEALAAEARARDAAVHMPLIGTGQGGTAWAPVRDLVLAELCDRDVDVVVYVLPGAPMPEDEIDEQQLSLL